MTSPNPGGYNQATTTVTTSATAIALVEADATGVLVQNNGSVLIYLGGPTVTSSGATQGVSVAAGATLLIPSTGSVPNTLYAVAASSTAAVAVLFASGA
jgi:hypothetical protein